MTPTAILKAKSNARWSCQECAATELIQGHHQIPGDDESIIVLCADCHSKKHPNVPKDLFFNHNSQPYWHNKSAASLARELGVHPRTVCRASKKLQILPGELSLWDEELIKGNIPKLQRVVRLKQQAYPTRTCPRCGYRWRGRPNGWAATCQRCNQWIPLNHPYVSPIRLERQVLLIP